MNTIKAQSSWMRRKLRRCEMDNSSFFTRKMSPRGQQYFISLNSCCGTWRFDYLTGNHRRLSKTFAPVATLKILKLATVIRHSSLSSFSLALQQKFGVRKMSCTTAPLVRDSFVVVVKPFTTTRISYLLVTFEVGLELHSD